MQTRILDPMNMRDSKVVLTPQINEPFLHGYTNERGVFEDSSFWNPTAFRHSGNMTTTVADVATGFAPSPMAGSSAMSSTRP